MSVKDQVIEFYNVLLDMTTQRAVEATQFLTEFYRSEEAFNVLTDIIFTHPDVKIKTSAAIGLRKCMKILSTTLEDKTEIMRSLLNVYSYDGSEDVRRNVSDLIETFLDGNTIPVVFEFIISQTENLTPLAIEVYCELATYLLPYANTFYEPNEEADAAVIAAGKAADLKSKFFAVCFSLNKDKMILMMEDSEEAPEEMKQNYLEAVQLLQELVESPVQFRQLCKLLVVFVDQTLPQVDVDTTLQAILEILSNVHDRNIIESARSLCDQFISQYSESIIENDELVDSIFAVYFSAAQATYNPDEHIFFDDGNIFYVIATEFSSSEHFISQLLQLLSEADGENQAQLYALVSCLTYTFANAREFYEKGDSLQTIAQVLISALEASLTVCMASAVATAIQEFGNTMSLNAESLAGPILELIISAIGTFGEESADVAVELIKASTSMVKCLEDTDAIFEQAVTVDLELIGEQIIVAEPLEMLTHLIKLSNEKASEHFEELYGALSNVIGSTEEGADVFIPNAILAMSHLSTKCIEQFGEKLEEFSGVLLSALASEDLVLQREAADAIGRLSIHYRSELAPIVAQAVDSLLQVASHDLTPPETNPEDEFMGDEDYKLDQEYNTLMATVGSSLHISCLLMKQYPDLIDTYYDALAELLQKIVSACALLAPLINDAADSMNFLQEGLKASGSDNAEARATKLVTIFTPALDLAFDPNTIGKVLEAITDTVSNFSVRVAIEVMPKILELVTDALQKTDEYVEEYHSNASRFLRELLDQLKEEALQFVSPFIELYNQLTAEGLESEFRDLTTQFFGDLVVSCPSQASPEILENLFILAKDAIGRSSSIGLTAIKMIAACENGGDTIRNHFDEIVEIFDPIIGDAPQTHEDDQIMQDNAASAMGKIATNVLREEFPLNKFAIRLLQLMPANVEVEENPDMMEFAFFVLETGTYNDAVASVFCRVFADPIEELSDYCFTEDVIERAASALRQILNEKANSQSFIASAVGNNKAKIFNVISAL